MSTQKLLEDSLQEPAIDQTEKFHWHATPIGIAALCKQGASNSSGGSYEDALKRRIRSRSRSQQRRKRITLFKERLSDPFLLLVKGLHLL